MLDDPDSLQPSPVQQQKRHRQNAATDRAGNVCLLPVLRYPALLTDGCSPYRVSKQELPCVLVKQRAVGSVSVTPPYAEKCQL